MVKITYDIFIPEQGRKEDIVFGKTEHDWKNKKVTLFPLPFPTKMIEMHVDENGMYNYEDFNMLGFDFLLACGDALKDHNQQVKFSQWSFYLKDVQPWGPIGLRVRNKKMLKELKEYFTGEKCDVTEESDEVTDSVDEEEDDDADEEEEEEEGSTPEKAIVISDDDNNGNGNENTPEIKELPIIKKSKNE